MARQLLVIEDCISVTTFTDNDIICRIWSNRRFPLTIQWGYRRSFNLFLIICLSKLFLSTHPVLGNPNTGSKVSVTSENYFAPTTSADVPSVVAPFDPASRARWVFPLVVITFQVATIIPIVYCQLNNTTFLRQLFFPH